MYTIQEVEINDFWHRLDAKCEFNDNVNIIIGRNGTGKTTFMNILHAALTVDLEELAGNDFSSITIKLVEGKKSRVIRVQKNSSLSFAFQQIDYKISNRRYPLRAVTDDARIPISVRKKILEEATAVRESLTQLINLSSLSVYRLKNTEDYEIKDRSGKRLMSPVDFRLMQLRAEITKYQFELSIKAREISANLQKDVLASILFAESNAMHQGIPSNFEKAQEERNLLSAYRRLGAYDNNIQKKISNHVNAVDEALKIIHSNSTDIKEKHFAAMEAFLRTQKIVDMSLRAGEKTLLIYSEMHLFTNTLKEFIPDKNFQITSGELKVYSATHKEEEILVSKLSSGEKQLIILLAEALLQRGKHFVYLADEPELSLHIDWQRKILPAIKNLNQNAQIIAATHSPEVASRYPKAIIDMKDVVNART